MGGRNLIGLRFHSVKSNFLEKSNFLDGLSRFDPSVLMILIVNFKKKSMARPSEVIIQSTSGLRLTGSDFYWFFSDRKFVN